MLEESGYKNIINVAGDHGFKIDKNFIDENYDVLSKDFPPADDLDHLADYRGEAPWWTFENEANSGSIDDTYPRDILLDNLALIILGMEWPINGDSYVIHNEFSMKMEKYLEGVK